MVHGVLPAVLAPIALVLRVRIRALPDVLDDDRSRRGSVQLGHEPDAIRSERFGPTG